MNASLGNAMNAITKKFLSLQPSSRVHAMRRTYEVTGYDLESALNEPILTDTETGQRLYGAMYIVHLMTFEVSEKPGACDRQAAPSIQTEPSVPDAAHAGHEQEDERVLASLPPEAFGLIDEFIYSPELLIGRRLYLAHAEFRDEERAFSES